VIYSSVGLGEGVFVYIGRRGPAVSTSRRQSSATINIYMTAFNPFIQFCHVRVRDRGYDVTISMNVTTRRVHAFKYSEERFLCDYSWFDSIDEALAWLETPL